MQFAPTPASEILEEPLVGGSPVIGVFQRPMLRENCMLVTRQVAALWLMATTLTLGSSAVHQMRPEVQDWDCPPAPASCARPVLVAGFPFPYLSDYHAISVVGRVTLVDAVLGIDHFHARGFWLNVDLYLLVTAATWGMVRRFQRRGPARLGESLSQRPPHAPRPLGSEASRRSAIPVDTPHCRRRRSRAGFSLHRCRW